MDISEITNKEGFSTIIINELKDIGVKYRKEKKSKIVQDKSYRKRIFRTHLHLLELTDVILANGRVVQIPKFVADSCNRVLEQVETEGIFRKAGSSIRQKEIRISLEAGVPLGKSHHVIDVANVVKFFFRELPEPLIPPSMQETLLRSLLIGENHVKAILLTCLLLPPLTINTLSFFMQFLYTVSLSAHENKMTIENLAIIFTPGLMPFPNINSHRFTNHVKMVRLLIEKSNVIGNIPSKIVSKLQMSSQVLDPESTDASVMSAPMTDRPEDKVLKKKKKRRSGSLTQMFNGLRKIVGSAIGSSEHLDSTPSENMADNTEEKLEYCGADRNVVSTPCLKANKKRKFGDPACAFSAKKRKDLLALLPSNSGGFLPNTPLTKESKKSRLSLGASRHMKSIALNPVVTSMERRWSIVGSGWSKNKNKHAAENKQHFRSNDCIFDMESNEVHPLDVGVNVKTDTLKGRRVSVPQNNNLSLDVGNISSARYEQKIEESFSCVDAGGNDSLKISKNEYEEIKERVAAIECRISHEFGSIRSSMPQHSPISSNSTDVIGLLSGPERVQTQYERIVVETEALSSPGTEQLAQRLSRGLKIRRSTDQQVIRSPSARKIGTMRRRSQEKMRLSRNPTWHMSSTKQDASSINSKYNKNKQQPKVEDISNTLPPSSFYAKVNLRRGKPNTLHTGLLPLSLHNSDLEAGNYTNNEQWMSGEEFFSDFLTESPQYKVNEDSLNSAHVEHVKTPTNHKIQFNSVQTPMLPPKSLPRKAAMVRTPLNASVKPSTTSKLPVGNRIAISTPIDEEASGRASIARLRTQNAGMVMAKAKLFDGLGNSNNERGSVERERSQHPAQMRSKNICVASLSHHDLTPEFKFFENGISSNSYMSDVTTPKTTMKNTPIAKRIQSARVNSTSSPKRRQRSTAVKYSQKQMIQSIVTDEKFIKTRNLNRANESISSPKTSINQSHHRHANSPRRMKKYNQQHSKFRTAISSPSGNYTKRTMQHCNSPRNNVSKCGKTFAL